MKPVRKFLIPALLLVTTGAGYPAVALASGPQLVPVEGVSWNVGVGLADNLRPLTGKRVTVMLRGGGQLTGRVKAVGTGFVHLEEIERKEHYDALVRLEDISAVDTRFRAFQRAR